MARGMQRHKNQKLLAGARPDHRMLNGAGAKIFRARFNVSNRAPAFFAEVVKSFRKRRKGANGKRSIGCGDFPVAIDGAADKKFLAAAISGDTRRNHLRRQHSIHAVLGPAHMFDAFKNRPAIRRGAHPGLLIGNSRGCVHKPIARLDEHSQHLETIGGVHSDQLASALRSFS